MTILLNASGALVENGWVKLSDKWYYGDASGKVTKNKWEKIKGVWYHLILMASWKVVYWKNKYYLK